jgi:Restriction endonuclease fold toxin 3
MLAPQYPARLRLSAKARRLYQQGKISEAIDVHYEDMVRDKTAGQSGDVQGREIDVVLDDAFIQVKRSYAAIERPRNFLNSHIRRQIKMTIRMAQDSGGSSTPNRGHEHHRSIRRFRMCEGRPRRFGGVQRGGGTGNANSSLIVQQWSVIPAAMAGVRLVATVPVP